MKSALDSSEDQVASHRAFQVLEQAVSRNRLAQSVLLHGDDLETLEIAGRALAARLLGVDVARLSQHPDLFLLRTRGKARQINIGSGRERVQGEWPPNTMRRFLHDIHLSPRAGDRKVGMVVEADRMNDSTANAFLKTLEEPPADTTLFLLTTRPYDLLDTIRSRCLNFKLPTESSHMEDPTWSGWCRDYCAWLEAVAAKPTDRRAVAHAVLAVYGLIERFELVLKARAARSWKTFQESLPDHLAEDELLALEAGLAKSMRQQLFAEIELQTRNFAIGNQHRHPSASFRPLSRAVESLEHLYWLVDRINLQETTALEAFLLSSMRLWAGR